MKIILKIFEWTIFIGVILLFLLIISPYLPFSNLPKTYIVVTGSMEPTVKSGSIAITQPKPISEIKAGDIIAFTSPTSSDQTILHRVNSIKSTDPFLITTKGDNNNAPDAWEVSGTSILGTHIFSIPYLGNAATFLRQPLGFILMIVVPALLFIFLHMFNIARTLKNNFSSILVIILSISSIISISPINRANAFFTDKISVTGIKLTTIAVIPTPTLTPTPPPNSHHWWFRNRFRAICFRNHHFVKFHFNNFPKFGPQDFLNYQLVYRHQNIEKGIYGQFDLKDNGNLEIDQYLGTCSDKVCTPDFESVSSATLTVTGRLGSENIEINLPVELQ